MEKLIKKIFKTAYMETKIGHLNGNNVLLKNNEKNRKQLYEKLYKILVKYLKIYIKNRKKLRKIMK